MCVAFCCQVGVRLPDSISMNSASRERVAAFHCACSPRAALVLMLGLNPHKRHQRSIAFT